MTEILSLSHAIGLKLRNLRLNAGKTQDQLAEGARAAGIDWTRNSVAGLESGRRQLSADELLLLPLVASRTGITIEGLGDLLPAEGMLVSVGQLKGVKGQHLRDLLWGHVTGVDEEQLDSEPELASDLKDWQKFSKALAWVSRMWPEASPEEASRILTDAGLLAEQQLAKRLAMTPLELSLLCHQLWGMGLTSKREFHLETIIGPPPIEGPAETGELSDEWFEEHEQWTLSRRATRGHIVRELTEEIVDALGTDMPWDT